MRYLVATIKPWNIRAYHEHTPNMPGEWHLVTKKEELTPALIAELKPRYIFFPHWSWIVPAEVLDAAECVCFHMTDVPYGRGGSPMQNLIARGHKETKLTALRMVEELDAGPVYLKRPLSLKGSGQEIFERSADLVYNMIKIMLDEGITPTPQTGSPVLFERRTTDMSVLPKEGSIELIYDHIRMLDADTYPSAFLNYGDFTMNFTNANMDADGVVHAQVILKKTNGEDET